LGASLGAIGSQQALYDSANLTRIKHTKGLYTRTSLEALSNAISIEIFHPLSNDYNICCLIAGANAT